jgi:DnaJ homolog subfamily B member 4
MTLEVLVVWVVWVVVDDRELEEEWAAWVAWEQDQVCLGCRLKNLKSLRGRLEFHWKSTSHFHMEQRANDSLYTGTTKRLKITRKQNDGSGRLVTAENVLEVSVKPGWKAGTKIRFPNAGDELVPGQAQTIAFVVEEKPHPIYKRDADDLSAELDLTLVEAFAGFSKELKTLDGRTLKVTGSPGNVVQPEQVKLFAREGMPNQRTGGKGNLRVKLNVKFPKSVTKEQVEGIKRLFGKV